MPGPAATARILSQINGTLVLFENLYWELNAIPNLMQQSTDADDLLCTLAEYDVLSPSGR